MKKITYKSPITRGISLVLCSCLLSACITKNSDDGTELPNNKTLEAPVVTNLVSGALHNNSTLAISGTALVGVFIEIVDENENQLGDFIADANGDWKIELSKLDDGEHQFRVIATDRDTGATVKSELYTITVDLSSPEAPKIITDVASLKGQQLPTIEGTAEANGSVEIFLDNQSQGIEQRSVGTISVDSNGKWVFQLDSRLPDGNNKLSVVVKDAAGNISSTNELVVIDIDTTPPNAPIFTADQKTIFNSKSLSITGTAEANSTVNLFRGDTSVGTDTADENGDWKIDFSEETDGTFTYTSKATDPANNTSASSSEFVANVDTTPPNTPEIDSPVAGNTNDNKPAISGTAEGDSTIEVFSGSNSLGSTTAAATGGWTLNLSEALTEGAHQLTAKSTDSADNSTTSSVVSIIVDTIPPNIPIIDSPSTGNTNDNMPTISGTAEGDSTIEVFSGSNLLGSTIAAATGGWTLNLSEALTEGAHQLTAKSTDSANNSSSSLPLAILVDITPPQKPTKPSLIADADSSTPGDKLRVNWDADVTDISGIDYYNIQIVDAANPEISVFNSNIGNVLEYVYVSDEIERQFAARIQAVDKLGYKSEWSDISNAGVIAKLSLTHIKTLMGDYPQEGQWNSPLTVTSTKTDSQGNIFVAGHFSGKLTLDPSGETPPVDASVSEDGFVVKLDPQGNYIKAWIAQSNGTNPQFFVHIKDIVLDADGNVFAVGHFSGAARLDSLDIEREENRWGFKNIIAVKLNSDLTWQWTEQLVGNGYDTAHGVDVDENGNIYFVGSMSSTNIEVSKEGIDDGFPVTRKSGSNLSEGSDILVAKFNTTSNKYSWIETFGFYVSAEANEWKPNVEQKSTAVGHDIIYNTSEHGSTVTLTGSFRDTILFNGNWCNNPSCFYSSNELGEPKDSIIVAQLDSTNGDYSWGRRIDAWGTGDGFAGGAWGNIDGRALSWLAMDNSDGIYVTSSYAGSAAFEIERDQFNDIFDDFRSSNNDSNDIFVTRLFHTGLYHWTKTIGGSGDDRSEGIIYDSNRDDHSDGHIHLTGSFTGTIDFDPSNAEDNRTASGSNDAFILSLNHGDAAYNWVNIISSTSSEAVSGRALTAVGNRLIAVGNLKGTADFNPNSDVNNAGNAGAYSIFVSDFKQITQPPRVDD